MNFAHMVGEHQYESLGDKLSHIVLSWAGFVATVIVGAIICYVVYKTVRKRTVKVKIMEKEQK